MKPQELRQKIVKRERWLKLIAVTSIIVLGLVILLAVPGMLVSFLLAFVITYLCKPIVNYFERAGMNRTVSVLIPFLLMGLLVSAVSGVWVPRMVEQASTLRTELPKYVKGITDLTKKHTSKINEMISPFTKVDIAEKAAEWVQGSGNSVLSNIPNLITQFLSTMLLAPFFAFFMLRDGRNVIHELLALVPNNLFEVILNLFYQINQQLGGFIRAKLLESVIVGLVVWVGLYLLSFPYASFLAIFAGVTNLIPYLGPLIGAVPGLVVALVNQETTTAVTLVGIVYMLAQVVDMLFVIPLVVARIVDLHPVTVVIVIIVGSQVMGIMGMIISVPVASILKLSFSEFYNHIVDFRG